MKIGWLMGWAVPEAWFAPLARQALPDAEHVFVAAEPDALARLERAGSFDWVAGYSLGSLLLLREAARADRLGRVALLAPIFCVSARSGAGWSRGANPGAATFPLAASRCVRGAGGFLCARWAGGVTERRARRRDGYFVVGARTFGERPRGAAVAGELARVVRRQRCAARCNSAARARAIDANRGGGHASSGGVVARFRRRGGDP
jgi:hypothetical protein